MHKRKRDQVERDSMQRTQYQKEIELIVRDKIHCDHHKDFIKNIMNKSIKLTQDTKINDQKVKNDKESVEVSIDVLLQKEKAD